MHCEICRNAGSKLAGNTDFVAGSKNFKRENIRIHENSGRHRKCCDTAIAQQRGIRESRIGQQFRAMEVKDDEKTATELKIKFNTAYCIGKI